MIEVSSTVRSVINKPFAVGLEVALLCVFRYGVNEPTSEIVTALNIMCVLGRLSHVRLLATLWTVACQAPQSMEFSRQE